MNTFEDKIENLFNEIVESGIILLSKFEKVLIDIKPIVNDSDKESWVLMYIDPIDNKQGVIFTKVNNYLIVSLQTENLDKDLYLVSNKEICLENIFDCFYNLEKIK